jgi:hypothetical protein
MRAIEMRAIERWEAELCVCVCVCTWKRSLGCRGREKKRGKDEK